MDTGSHSSEDYIDKQGFPQWVNLLGGILSKMATDCMKITKSTFWGQASFLGSGEIPPVSPTRGNPMVLT